MPPRHSQQPHQNRRRFGNGKSLLRPHAGLDEETKPGHRWRDRVRVQSAVRVRPRLEAVLLQGPGPFRGPGPWSLVPGHPGTDFRIERFLARPASHEWVRPAGLFYGQYLPHVRECDERVRP